MMAKLSIIKIPLQNFGSRQQAFRKAQIKTQFLYQNIKVTLMQI